jgi:hypothetical protein
MIGGNFFIAAAVRTKRFAKGKVYIEADAIHMVLPGKCLYKYALPRIRFQLLVPERNGRIACIAWQGEVVFPHQQGINCFIWHHIPKVEFRAGEKHDAG